MTTQLDVMNKWHQHANKLLKDFGKEALDSFIETTSRTRRQLIVNQIEFRTACRNIWIGSSSPDRVEFYQHQIDQLIREDHFYRIYDC